MITVHKVSDLQALLARERGLGKSIGLVPTMGALHEGHASLARRSVSENDVTVVSIFLNPTQFNDKTDLEKYPRTLEADCRLLEECGVQVAFAPSVEEVYPEPDTRTFSYPPTDAVMEGAMRPGHFNGVCQIVSKLFAYVSPDKAYFGEKDFQQIAVIRQMVKICDFKLDIISCPIVREADGLAVSSRNTLLTPEHRKAAPRIHAVLEESKALVGRMTPAELIKWTTDKINQEPLLCVEYYEIVDALTLQPIGDWSESDAPHGCITVQAGNVRLIDNISLK